MGEIVDLEKYRRQHKQGVQDSQVRGNRRSRNSTRTKGDNASHALDPIDTDRAEPDPATVADRDDKTTE